MMDIQLMTATEVAKYLKINKKTLNKLLETDQIPYVIISTRGDKRFRKQDIEAFINNKHHE